MSNINTATIVAIAATLRTTAEIEANIDAINKQAEETGTPADGGLLSLLTLEAKVVASLGKFATARTKYESQAAVRDVEVGSSVSLVHGRKLTKTILSGNVLHIEQEKSGPVFTVLTGVGKDSKTVNVSADALLLSAEAVAEAQAEIDAAIAEAAANAPGTTEGEGSAE